MSYRHTLAILRDLRPFFGLSAVIFTAAAVLGFFTTSPRVEESAGPAESIELTFQGILFNNAAVLLLMLLGCITFGLTAAFLLFTTGSSLGGLIHIGLTAGLEPTAILLLIVPHGIIELPGFFLASAISFQITRRLVEYLLEYRETPFSSDELTEYLFLVVVAFGLIVVAAGVEAAITLEYARDISG